MHQLLGWRGALAPTEAVRPPSARSVLPPPGGGGGLQPRHAFGRVVPLPLLQFLLQVADAGFQLRDQRPLLGNDRLQLLDQLTLANH